VTDASGAYAGLVDVANVHAEAAQQNGERDDTLTVEQVASQADSWVDIHMRFDRLMPLFESRETELLVVVDEKANKRVVGLITEAFALRRYRQEIEVRQRELFGSQP